MKKLLALTFVALMVLTVSACSGSKGTIEIWVGDEVQEFYQNKANEYITQYETETGDEFPYTIDVKAADTGTAAGVFLDDPDAGPDILTVAHDNLGRLISGSPAIAPITSDSLLTQIQDQNPQSFINVIQGEYDGETYFFGAPYEAQALVLYYNSKYLTEDDVDTWEEIWEVAKTQNMRATTVTGTDGFNNSFLVLASNAQTGEMPVTIYEGGDLNNTEFVTDGAVSVMKWGIRFFSDPNGAQQASDSGWEVDLGEEETLSIIGGAWHFNAVQSKLGNDMAVAKLPTFTLTEDDVYGDIAAGTVMQSGTFADTKMFVMNRRSDKLEYLEGIVQYLSHKDIQKESFETNGSLPAYEGVADDLSDQASTDIKTELALAQIEMFEHGIAQPFGVDPRFNFYYYQKQGPELLYQMLTNDSPDMDFMNESGEIIEANVVARMTQIENIWLNISEE